MDGINMEKKYNWIRTTDKETAEKLAKFYTQLPSTNNQYIFINSENKNLNFSELGIDTTKFIKDNILKF